MSVPRLWPLIPCVILVGATVCAPAASQPDYTITDNVNLVLLDVSVKNSEGHYVKGLSSENFTVAEDGRPRTITHFANVDAPVTVGLVVDNSGSMQWKRPEVVMAGLAFARESNPDDQFFVVNFNSRIYFGLPSRMPFTDQLQTLRSALFYGQPVGQTALYDAVALALRHLELSAREKRTLIVVSDGGDNASHISLKQVLGMAQASRATVYTVGLFDPADRDLNPKVLRKISKTTGGEFLCPENSNEVLVAFKTICRDIRSRYSIGFVPALNESRKLVHSVKVTAKDSDGRKLTVLTRTSYIAPLSEQFAGTQQTAQKAP
jgi:Ca-activated chloride channel homolog